MKLVLAIALCRQPERHFRKAPQSGHMTILSELTKAAIQSTQVSTSANENLAAFGNLGPFLCYSRPQLQTLVIAMNEETLRHMRERIKRCYRLAKSTTDERTAAALLEMAAEGEADLARMSAEGVRQFPPICT